MQAEVRIDDFSYDGATMEWRIDLPGTEADAALSWLQTVFEGYDTRQLEYVRIGRGSRRYEGVYGHCEYPADKRTLYRISCFAPGPFPCTTVTRKPPLYPRSDGTFPRAPRGCRRGELCCDPSRGRSWYRVLGKTQLADLEHAVVWIVSHETFHFLRHSRQIPGRNNEIEADRFADETMERVVKGARDHAAVVALGVIAVQRLRVPGAHRISALTARSATTRPGDN